MANQARLTSLRLSPWIKFVDWRIAALEQEARSSLGARLKLDALKSSGAL